MSLSTTAPERATTGPATTRADIIRALLRVGHEHPRLARAVEELIPLVTDDQDQRVELDSAIEDFPALRQSKWHWRVDTTVNSAPLGEAVAICSSCAPGPEGSAAYRRTGLNPWDAAFEEPGTMLRCAECGAEGELA